MVKPDKRLDLGLDAKRIGKRIKENAKKARNEEELKIKVEGLIQEIIAKFFAAVSMMREIRDKLSKRYSEDPEAERRDLQDIRRKYGITG